MIILASGEIEREFGELYPVKTKAFVPLGEKMMVEYVLDALSAVPELAKRIIVTPDGEAPDSLDEMIHSVTMGGESIMDSLKAGMSCLDSLTGKVLVVPCDLPLLSPEAVQDFLAQCEGREADIHYSYVMKEDSEKAYPGLHHTYVSLKDGVFCGGGLVLLSKEIVPKCERLFSLLTGARKNPLRMTGILGISIILKFLTGNLRVADLEERVSRLLQARAAGIRTTFSEVGFNVDDLSTLERAGEIIGSADLEEAGEGF